MSKRLQVLMNDSELRDIRRTARLRRITVAEWVRQALRAARRGESAGDPAKKIAAIRKASKYSFPAPDAEQMLEEIERGYFGGAERS